MSDWHPNPNGILQLRTVLAGTLSPNKLERHEANEALNHARLQSDLDNYLLYILIDDTTSVADIRASAGLMLKNNIIKHDFVRMKSKELQQAILGNILRGLLDDNLLVRNITGNVITSLFQLYGITEWPQVLVQLLELVNGSQASAKEGAISALAKICEDSLTSLDSSYNGEVPSSFLIPNFLSLVDGSNSSLVVAKSIHCINQFVTIKSPSITAHMGDFLSKLFALTGDTTESIRKAVCTSFYLILDTSPEFLFNQIEGITNYCLHTIIDVGDNEEVALPACEFLLVLSGSNIEPGTIKALLPSIVPLLLEKMVYSPSDIEYYEQVDSFDDAEVEDKDEDIKPVLIKAKEKTAKAERKELDEEEEEEEDEDNDLSEWSLRKCSAASLDLFATAYPETVIGLTLPLLQKAIVSPKWPVREAAILAFGAISDACVDLEAEKVPSLISFLVERLKDTEPRVRQITCWTLSRYAAWVCSKAHKGEEYSNYYLPTLEAIMACALDNKKIVQESALSSFSSFIASSDYELIANFVEPILLHFNKCFKKYKRKNLVMLYDAVQTFVDKVGDVIATNQYYINLLLPPLLEKWELLPDNDRHLWPLLECMSSVAASLGELFSPYAVPTYQRAKRILSSCINLGKMCKTDPSIDSPEKDFIVTAVDLIDGLIQGLGAHSAELILNDSGTNLIDLLLSCFQDPVDEVRQSSFALLGDLSIMVMRPVVLPYLSPVIECIVHEINNRSYKSSAVCNNAAWTMGEIALVLNHDELAPYLGEITASLIGLVNSHDCEQTALENSAIALGRLGNPCSLELSQHLAEFGYNWCKYMKYLEPNEEKESSFKGMCNIVAENPAGLARIENGHNVLVLFIECIGSYTHPGVELNNMFGKLVHGYKEMLGADWANLLGNLTVESQAAIQERY